MYHFEVQSPKSNTFGEWKRTVLFNDLHVMKCGYQIIRTIRGFAFSNSISGTRDHLNDINIAAIKYSEDLSQNYPFFNPDFQ